MPSLTISLKSSTNPLPIGRITDERFDTLLAEYEAEQKTLQASVAEAEQRVSSFEEDTVRVEQFMELARKYTDFSELTTMMINEFIDKIIVHAPEKVDGDRVQEVEIYLKFIGHFELPAPELTAEEIKRQEQLKRHRIKSRERYQKMKAGEHAIGQLFKLTCKCCGKEFEPSTPTHYSATVIVGRGITGRKLQKNAAERLPANTVAKPLPQQGRMLNSAARIAGMQAQIKRQASRKKALREEKSKSALPGKRTKNSITIFEAD